MKHYEKPLLIAAVAIESAELEWSLLKNDMFSDPEEIKNQTWPEIYCKSQEHASILHILQAHTAESEGTVAKVPTPATELDIAAVEAEGDKEEPDEEEGEKIENNVISQASDCDSELKSV